MSIEDSSNMHDEQLRLMYPNTYATNTDHNDFQKLISREFLESLLKEQILELRQKAEEQLLYHKLSEHNMLKLKEEYKAERAKMREKIKQEEDNMREQIKQLNKKKVKFDDSESSSDEAPKKRGRPPIKKKLKN
jgi:hypothetical protein